MDIRWSSWMCCRRRRSRISTDLAIAEPRAGCQRVRRPELTDPEDTVTGGERTLLGVAVEAARMAALGQDYAEHLLEGLDRAIGVDAGAAVTWWHIDGLATNNVTMRTYGTDPLDHEQVAAAQTVVHQHPLLSLLRNGSAS